MMQQEKIIFIDNLDSNFFVNFLILVDFDNRLMGLEGRVFPNGPGDPGSYQRQKMVLDASLLNTQHYKVQVKVLMEQSRERSSALPYSLV